MAKFLNRNRIEEALDDYLKDANFKEQNDKLKKDRNSLFMLAWGWNNTGEVDPAILNANKTLLDRHDLFVFNVIPKSTDIDERIKYYEQVGDKNKLRNLQLLKQLSTNTAYIMPVADPEMKELRYFVTVGQEFHDEINSWDYSNGMKDRAVAFAMFHEFTHFLRSDVNPWKDNKLKKKYSNVSSRDWNIMHDTFINSNGLRNFHDTAAALLDKLGVRGETVGRFLSTPIYIQAVDDMKDKYTSGKDISKFKEAVADRMIEYYTQLGGKLNATDKQQLKASIMQRDNEHFDKLVSNLKSIGSSKDFFSSLNKQWQPKLDDYIQNKLMSDNMKLPDRYIDVATFVRNNALGFENGDSALMNEDLWADYLDKVNSLLPPEENDDFINKRGKKGKKGKKGQIQDHSNNHDIDPDDEVELNEDETNNEMSRIAHTTGEIMEKLDEIFKQHGHDFGNFIGQKLDIQLKPTDHELMHSAISMAMRRSIVLPEPVIEEKMLPIINGPLNHVKHIANQHRMSQGLQPLGGSAPKGVLAYTEKIKNKPRIAMMFIDESASVSDAMLSAAKTAIAKICKERNLMVITFSNSASDRRNMGKYLEPSVFNPAKSNINTFVKRLVSGGTDNPMQYVANLDKIFEDKEFQKRLQKELKKQQSDIDINSIVESAKNGDIASISVTDGDLPTYNLNDVEKEYLAKIVKNKKIPLTIVTWRPISTEDVLANLPKDKLKKYVTIIPVK